MAAARLSRRRHPPESGSFAALIEVNRQGLVNVVEGKIVGWRDYFDNEICFKNGGTSDCTSDAFELAAAAAASGTRSCIDEVKQDSASVATGVPSQNSNSDVLMMQAAQNQERSDGADRLRASRMRRVLIQ